MEKCIGTKWIIAGMADHDKGLYDVRYSTQIAQ